MIRQLFNIDPSEKFVLAVSGGADSMAAADFFRRGRKTFLVAHFNHRTEHAPIAQECVERWCRDREVELVVGRLEVEKRKGESPEEFWRNERYGFLKKFGLPIVTAHHLDDAVETWIFSSLHGRPHLIPSRNPTLGVMRPFLVTEKADLVGWCERHSVPFVVDPSNGDVSFVRNRIRKTIVPEAYRVNPGLRKVVRSMYGAMNVD